MARSSALVCAVVAVGAGALALGRLAVGHVASLPIATLSNPRDTGDVADTSYTFYWMDADKPVATGTVTIDFFYTASNPPPFPQGTIPSTLTGTVVVSGVLEKDTTNHYTWDTSAVPAGSYWIWSHVVDPPGEPSSIPIATLSPGVVTIAHASDPVPPAVVITKPDSPFRWADTYFEVTYSASDPDGSGKVRLEATKNADGSDLVVIADDLPAVEKGSYVWDTTRLEETDWVLRATITDGRGLSFSSFARYWVLVTHAVRPGGDAGVLPDGALPDAAARDASLVDAGGLAHLEDPPSCTCLANSRAKRAASRGRAETGGRTCSGRYPVGSGDLHGYPSLILGLTLLLARRRG